jgi:hypothetical protein
MEKNKFELVYDSMIEEEEMRRILSGEGVNEKVKGLESE